MKPYQFGYQIKDKDGNVQHRHEESDAEGVKRGSYGYVDANGVFRKVFYVADKNGFRIKEMKSNEPGFDAKVAAAMKETSKVKTPVDTIASTASAHYSSPSVNQLSPSLLSSDSGNYNPSKITATDREFNNQRVKASFNLNTSESKKDSSKAKHSNVYQSIANKVKDNHSHNHHHNHHHNNNNNNKVISHSSLPETALRPPYTETYSTSSDGLINNPSYSRDIGSSGDTRREFTHEPYVYYAQPPLTGGDHGHASLPLMPVRSIDTTFPYKFVSPRGIYNNNGDSNSVSSGNPLQSSHSMPIYSSVSSSPSSGKHMSPYLQALPIHTYRAPLTNTSSSNYGVNYASNSPPKTVYIPVYPPIMSHNHDHHSYGNDGTTYAPTTPHYGPFESTRLRAPEPTSSTTLGYMHPLQPVRSATTPAYSSPPSDKYHHHHHHHHPHHSNYNSPPIDNSIDRPSDHVKHHHRNPADHPYHSPQYASHSHSPNTQYPSYPGFSGGSSPSSSSPGHERPLQYLDGPGPGSMIGTNRMQPTVFYVTDLEGDDHLVKKQHTVDPSGYDDVPPPHRTGHDPTPHGFESPFIDVPPTAPPVPPPEADNNQPPPGAGSPGPPGSPGGHHHHPSAGGPNNGLSPHDHPSLPHHHPHHHHPAHSSPDHLSGYPSPPTPPGHPSNPYYNPYNPYAPPTTSNNMITDPARARLASYYQAVRQAAPATSSASSGLSVSPSTSSSPSTLNVPSVLLGIQSAQGLEVATSLGSLSDTDVNYNPSHYPTPDQLNKWKARTKSSSYRRNRNRNSILNIDDDSDDDSVITSSSDVDLQRIKLVNSAQREVKEGESKKNNITATKMSPPPPPAHDESTNNKKNESFSSSTVLTRSPTWFGGLT